jgi:hypothetical protein
MLDPRLLWFRSTERTSVYVEGQNFVPDDEGYIAVPENLGSYITRIPGFVYVGREREQDQKPVEPNFVKTPTGGRPEKFLWDDIWIETCRYLHNNGVPATRAELMKYLQQWCEDHLGKQPADSTLKLKIRKLFVALERPDEN